LIEESLDRGVASRLLPWRPVRERAGTRVSARHSAAATTAAFYEAVDAVSRVDARIAALFGILRGELSRTRAAERKVREGLLSFATPIRHRRMGEALLASLRSAKRSGDVVVVPTLRPRGAGDRHPPRHPGKSWPRSPTT